MGLESANYISDLVPTWPLGTDKIRQGDDHLREIKKAIKNTFPNIDGPVTVTPAVLNALPANLSAIIAELIAHVVPMGVINAWSGSIGSIPVGWALCNGQTISGFGVTPDLRDRFIVGAGNSYAVGVTGGAASVTSGAAGGHDHGGTTVDTVLTVSQIPAHSHRPWVSNGGPSDDQNPFGINSNQAIAGNSDNTRAYRQNNGLGEQLSENTGGGAGHNHPLTAEANHSHSVANLPPYYALAYIIKVTQYVAP